MRKGFTLVELLIVLAVIAALMAVATPLALNAVKNAKASQVAQNFRNIKTAVENYWNTEKPTAAAAITGISIGTLVSSKYLSATPTNFSVAVTTGTGGVYNCTITYSGKDVDADKVRSNGMGEVQGNTGADLTLTFNLQKWW
ncbi:type II secretion system protein [Fervidobacterium gondwanense]|uniref:Prepilin-type N-terminal cleavage/methylation domain-containing protein n=1 Tax=Fervidobacterium gondwanense DSM 13020 TaxID=1121883 RepID=A0A1M7SYN5_FERGO|nr:type II secretion system protein [Fervidobacterium gondwanense]SHN63556.1 prepilin-type N-terminal cleavage/methylation domain-containing protein [Fervidobacterium gondwanense DSM 13020]